MSLKIFEISSWKIILLCNLKVRRNTSRGIAEHAKANQSLVDSNFLEQMA